MIEEIIKYLDITTETVKGGHVLSDEEYTKLGEIAQEIMMKENKFSTQDIVSLLKEMPNPSVVVFLLMTGWQEVQQKTYMHVMLKKRFGGMFE